MAESKSLKTAVKKAVGKAQKDAGDVETVAETKGGPTTDAPKDLPTGARSHP